MESPTIIAAYPSPAGDMALPGGHRSRTLLTRMLM
jgi:hypothetical protein